MSLSENGQKHAGMASIRDQGAEKHAPRAAVAVSTAETIRLLRVSSLGKPTSSCARRARILAPSRRLQANACRQRDGARPPIQTMIAFLDDHREVHGVEPICRVLPIAPSTYRDHVAKRRPG